MSAIRRRARGSRIRSASLLVLAWNASACTGVLGSRTDDGALAEGDGSAADGDDTGVLGAKGLHRLNTAEYNATVADVLGTTLVPATANWRGGELGGFDNMASVLGVDDTQYERYFTAAEALAEDVLKNSQSRERLIPCEIADDPECIQRAVEAAGRRIFRRPLSEEELGTYAKVYHAARELGDDHPAALGLVIRALLSSAEFLYRIEVDDDSTSTEERPLDAFELASRLSYFLWSSAPDDELLSLAEAGTLTNDEVLRETTARMLGDPKSDRFVSNFGGQWLGARRVVDHPTSPEVYPGWTPEVAHAAAEEMSLYFAEFLRSDRSWLDFLRADVNFVNAPLARHYGLPEPATGTERIDGADDARTGFLGLAGFLAMSSMDRRTSPTLRGKWVLMNLMCTTPPPPPPGADIAELDETDASPSENVREKLDRHRAEPACANCHALFDPFGLALEQFDGIGQFRTTYPDGSVIDPDTDLDGVPFSGLEGTIEVVSSHPDFGPCLIEKMLTYALGRPLTDGDQPFLDQLAREWLEGGPTPTLSRAVEQLVLSKPFRYRAPTGDRGDSE